MRKSILAIVFSACFSMAFASAADDAKALAEKGDTAAQFRYGEMLREGDSVATNLTRVAEWARNTAYSWYTAVQCLICHMNA